MPKEKKYPQKSDIETHKRALFTALIQYFIGVNDWTHVEQCFRALMSDAALWVKNNSKVINLKTGGSQPIDIEKIRRMIETLKITFDDRGVKA